MGRYQEFDEHENEVYRERLSNLRDVYREMVAGLEEDGVDRHDFFLNYAKSKVVTIRYIQLMKEYKFHHNDDRYGDNYKRAAYISLLISRYKPIKLTKNNKISKELLSLNSIFAVKILFYFIGVPRVLMESEILATISRDLIFIFDHAEPNKEMLVVLARALSMIVQEGGRR